MALTGLTNLQPLHIKTVGIGTFDNAVSIGGTLTYEDVTNVDAIGIITARSGINVSGGQLDVGSNIKLGNAGVITATSFVGSGSGLTGLNSDLVNDSSPQLGGALDVNGNNIQSGNAIYQIVLNQRHRFYSGGNQIIDINGNGVDFLHGNNTHADDVQERFGDDNDLKIYHSSGINYIDASAGHFALRGTGNDNILYYTSNGDVEIYDNGNKKFETTNTGAIITGVLTATSFSGDGSSLSNLPAGAPVGGASTNTVFFENDKAVAVNYQITSTKNAMSAGPIAINAGIAVTVPSGSSWTIV